MTPDASCPACDRRDWERLGGRVFDRRDAARLPPHVRRRYDVLFDLWAPGQSRLSLDDVLCSACGFVAYLPRPTEADIEAKYRRLSETEPGGATAPPAEWIARSRSLEIIDSLGPASPSSGRVLDFGGGTGALMVAFVERGFECSVVDYTLEPVAGVRRLGATLDDLPSQEQFDVIVSSHVFEHLASPVDVARRLRQHLRPTARLFIEVPLEIIGGPATPPEPVTHVNYFTPGSLSVLLARAGYVVERAWAEPCTFHHGRYRFGVRAVARLTDGEVAPSSPRSATDPSLADEARGWLATSALGRLRHVARYPRLLANPLRSLRRRFDRAPTA